MKIPKVFKTSLLVACLSLASSEQGYSMFSTLNDQGDDKTDAAVSSEVEKEEQNREKSRRRHSTVALIDAVTLLNNSPVYPRALSLIIPTEIDLNNGPSTPQSSASETNSPSGDTSPTIYVLQQRQDLIKVLHTSNIISQTPLDTKSPLVIDSDEDLDISELDLVVPPPSPMHHSPKGELVESAEKILRQNPQLNEYLIQDGSQRNGYFWILTRSQADSNSFILICAQTVAKHLVSDTGEVTAEVELTRTEKTRLKQTARLVQ